MKRLILTMMVMFLMLGGVVQAQDCVAPEKLMTLTWDAPTKNTDGSDLTDLAGYKIYKSDTFVTDHEVASTEHPLCVAHGDSFHVTAFDNNHNESDASNIFVVDIVAPAPPTGCSLRP